MEKFEYRVLRSNNMPFVGNGHDDLEKLNELGGMGWELVQVETSNPLTVSLLFFSSSKIHKEKVYYMRRKILDENIDKKTVSEKGCGSNQCGCSSVADLH